MPCRGVGAAFRLVGVDVYPLDDARVAAIRAWRIQPFKDFRESRCHGIRQPAGGKVPPGR
jgi:hypothetical protein